MGLTIVAFGTSSPELSVSLISSLNGSYGLCIGNIIGSNLFNILMVVGALGFIICFLFHQLIIIENLYL